MVELKSSEFADFFQAIHQDVDGLSYPPMDWQCRLAELACEGQWPALIDLPTGSGKTSCLDIATFALAYQADRKPKDRTAPMRTFLVVDRRIVVDDAFRRAEKISEQLSGALKDKGDSVLKRVALRLLAIQGVVDTQSTNAIPIKPVQLRGGIYRDTAWALSAVQPLLVTSTVDQVGSRMLFRGYGLSNSAKPIHASLVACDSLILLDEAHCSKAFAQTMSAVRNFQSNASLGKLVSRPLVNVEMTATPSTDVSHDLRFELTPGEKSDRESVLGKRRFASKPVALKVCEKATGRKAQDALASELAGLALKMVSDARLAIAIVVNRVVTAKKVYAKLLESRIDGSQFDLELMIGRMRAVDRNYQAERLTSTIASGTKPEDRPKQPLFVVATQCIEVGADLDFDAMICEAAPLDALRQRFGRLNRTARGIAACGAVVIQAINLKSEDELKSLEEKKEVNDPIYGNALSRTWNELWNVASEAIDNHRTIDFGIAAMDETNKLLGSEKVKRFLSTAPADAPVLLPAHLDMLCQTSPPPVPDQDVSLWLHGPQRPNQEVNVCWRSDLSLAPVGEDDRAVQWIQAVSLCPPTSLECMPVSIALVKRWLTEVSESSDDADIPVLEQEDEDQFTIVNKRQCLAWRGPKESKLLTDSRHLRPGDTIVLPVEAGGWSTFGYIPTMTNDPAVTEIESIEQLDSVDMAEQAFEEKHKRRIVRVSGRHVDDLSREKSLNPLLEFLKSDEVPLRKSELLELVEKLLQSEFEVDRARWEKVRVLLSTKFRTPIIDRYAFGQFGIVLTEQNKVEVDEDEGDDELSERNSGDRVALNVHLDDVERLTKATCEQLPLDDFRITLETAARMHDWGKADLRFQALLIRENVSAAVRQPFFWAKSSRQTSSRRDYDDSRRRATLPTNFRHEMLSVQLAEKYLQTQVMPNLDLVLHLIGSHHGYARPWVPVCDDKVSIDVEFSDRDTVIALTAEWRLEHPVERLDSRVAERFWSAIQQFGWWGTAFLETVLRLADQEARNHRERSRSQLWKRRLWYESLNNS
jgi:CRISPR-associated endonuclease/helicase Cas3